MNLSFRKLYSLKVMLINKPKVWQPFRSDSSEGGCSKLSNFFLKLLKNEANKLECWQGYRVYNKASYNIWHKDDFFGILLVYLRKIFIKIARLVFEQFLKNLPHFEHPPTQTNHEMANRCWVH